MTTTITQPDAAELARLAPTRGLGAVQRQYAVSDIEVRAADGDSTLVNFKGHASVTGRAYPMYGGPDKGGWDETITPGAFTQTLSEKPDVAFLLNHGGMTLARTKSGTLELVEDNVGLAVKASLDTRQSVVNDITVAMQRGDLDEMSFAFRVKADEWRNAEGEPVEWWDMSGVTRSINEVTIDHGDVSVVNYGANPFTTASLRDIKNIAMADPELVNELIEHLRGLLPEAEPTVVASSYYADLATLHARRQPAA